MIGFHFPTRLNVYRLYKFLLQKSKLKHFFCSIFHTHFQRASGYLFKKKIPGIFGDLGYIVFIIHNMLCCAQLQVFHTFEKNSLATVNNWWSLIYGQVYISLLVLLPFFFQPLYGWYLFYFLIVSNYPFAVFNHCFIDYIFFYNIKVIS